MNRKQAGFTSLLVVLCAALAVVFSGVNQHPPPRAASPSPVRAKESARTSATTSPNATSFATKATAHAGAVDSRNPFASFRGWVNEFKAETDPSRRAGMLARGVELAGERRKALAALIPLNPKQALAETVPLANRSALPPEIVSQLEDRVSGRGDFTVFGSVPLPGATSGSAAVTRQVAVQGARYDAYVYGARAKEITRLNIPLHGIAVDKALAVDENPIGSWPAEAQAAIASGIVPRDAVCGVSGEVSTSRATQALGDYGGQIIPFCCAGHMAALNKKLSLLELANNPGNLAGDSGIVGTNGAVTSSHTKGTKTLLYIRVAFQDDLREPDSAGNVAAAMEQVNQYFVAASFNNTAIISTVCPLVVLPQTKQWYGTNGAGVLQTDARAGAVLAGYDYSNYDLDIVRLSSIPAFNWGGLAEVGGRGVWLQTTDVTTTCHELGHNYGLLHANYWNTDRPPLTANDPANQGTVPFDTESVVGHSSVIGPGTDAEYGDPFDIMGGGSGHYNVVAKYTLNWLPDSFVAEAPYNATNRIYAMDGGALVPGRNYGVKVRKDSTRNYWVSHRSLLTGSAAQVNGVELHWDSWYQTDGTAEILDTTPGSGPGTQDAPIPLGRSFDDPESDLHLTLLAKGGTGPDTWADVVVNRGPFPGNLPPTLSLQASATTLAGANGSVTFTAAATDPNGDVLSYFWDFGDGTFGTNASTVTKQWSFAGDYVVRCEVSDMKGGVTRSHVTVLVGQPGTLRVNGRVLDTSGNPVAGARVDNGALNANNTLAANYVWTYTDSDGSYTLSGLAPTNYICNAYLHGYKTYPVNFVNPVSLLNTSPDNVNFLATPLTRIGVTTNSVAVTGQTNSGIFTITSNGDTNFPQAVVFGTGGNTIFGVDYQLMAPVFSLTNAPTNTGPPDYGPVTTQVLTNIGLNSGFGTLVTNIVSFGLVVIPAGTNSVNVLVSPSGSASNSTPKLEPSTVSLFLPYPLQELGFLVNTNLTNNSPYVPGWEVLDNAALTAAFFQTYPDYNLVFGREEATMLIQSTTPPGLPLVTMVALDDVAAEGSPGGGLAAVVRFGDSSSNLVVQYSTSGTAVPGVDYATLSGSVLIPAGQDSALIPVQPIQNQYVRLDSSLTLTLLPEPSYTVGQSNATVAILGNNPAAVALDVQSSTATPGGPDGLITVTRYGSATNDLVVKYLVSGTAKSAVDYQPLSGSLLIPAGALSAALDISALANPANSGNVTVVVSLSSSTTYEVQSPSQAVITVQNGALPFVTVTGSTNNVTQPSTATTLTFARTGDLSSSLTVFFQASGSALPGIDYTSLGSSVLIPAGKAAVTVNVTPDGTLFQEAARALFVQITGSASYNIGNPGVAVINFDPANTSALPAVGFVLASATNPASVTAPVIALACSANPGANSPITVSVEAIGGTAQEGVDFTLATNSLSFTNGSPLIQKLPLQILDHTNYTGDRTIVFQLIDPLPFGTNNVTTNTTIVTNGGMVMTNTVAVTNVILTFPPTNAYLIDQLFFYTIQDDYHGTIQVSATGPTASYAQGLNGSFTLARTGRADLPVTVNCQVAGTAVGGIGYAVISNSFTLPAGVSSLTIPVVPLNNPTLDIPQTVVLTLLDAPGAAFGSQSTASVQLLNDNGTIQFATTSYYAHETDTNALIAVERTGDTNSAVSVNYFVSNGTAKSGANYSANNGTLVFAPGQTVQSISVTPIHDFRVTGTMTVNLQLSNPTGGAPLAGQSTAVLYILDVDSAFNFLQPSFTVNENGGNAIVTVVRSGTSTNKATVDYATTNGTATGGIDFSNVQGTLFFDAGVVTQTFLVPILDHTNTPDDQTVDLSLLNQTGGEVPGTTTNAVLTILSDNSSIQFDAAGYSVNEFATNAIINVRRTGGTVNTVKFAFTTLNGTAAAGIKYLATNGIVSFLGDSYVVITNGSGGLQRVPGETVKSISIPILEDKTGDGNEFFTVRLSNPQGPQGSLAGTTILGNPTNTIVTILDDKIPGGPVIGFNPGLGPDANVNAVAPQPDGRVIIGGDFGHVGGTIFNHIARLNADGSVDSSFNPGFGTDQSVHALSLQPDGKILLGGGFASVNAQAIPNLARLNVDGSVDTNFVTDAVTGVVWTIVLQADSKILVGGDFGLTRLNPDGTPDPSFVGGATDGGVLALLVQPDGQILAGGKFSLFNGASAPHLVRLNAADGSLDSSFNIGSGPDLQVNAIAIQSSGRIVIGGGFASLNGLFTGPLARLNTNGSFDQSFAAGTGLDNGVLALDTYQDSILVAGQFANFNTQPFGRFLRLNPDGSVDPVFLTETGANGPVLAARFTTNGSSFVGGAFTQMNGIPRNHVAWLHGNEFFPSGFVQFTAAEYDVTATAGAAVVTVSREGGTNAASTVAFATQDGSAGAGVDYSPTNGVLNFAPGVTAQSFTVPILSNPNATNTSGLHVLLQSPTGASLGFITTAAVEILDTRPAFAFQTAAVRALEDAGSVTLEVVVRGQPTNALTVGYATQDGTAQDGVNYTAQQGTLTFGPGQTNASITIGLIDQNLANSTNLFTVTLSNPGPGSTIGAPSTTVISEVGVGALTRFSLTVNGGGGTVSPPSGLYLSNSVQVLAATPPPDLAFAGWVGTVASTNNPLVLRMTRNYDETATYKITQFTDSFSSGNFSALPWRSTGNAAWYVEATNIAPGGQFSAQSGRITDSQSTSLRIDLLTQAGTAAFDYKVSSETNWDWLQFYVNGTMLAEWSGETGWATYEFQVPAGTNHFEWTYIKDPTISVGLDAGFIDNLFLPLPSPATNPPPSLALSIPNPGVYRITINGTLDRYYLLQVSTDLLHWQPLSTNLFTLGGSSYDDAPTTNAPVKFYRAISSP